MTTRAPWPCPTCLEQVDSTFCPACGEQPASSRHLMVRDLAKDAFEAATSLDGKLLRSIRALILRPGELTAAWVAGRRKAFIGPLPLFLAANALFFAVQSASAINIFATPLVDHLTHQDWKDLAGALTSRHLAADGVTLEAYAPLFDQAAILHAKSLIGLMPVAFCGLPALLFANRRQPMAVHGVFALHLYAFLLLLFCVCLGISAVDVRLGGQGLQSRAMDVSLSLLNLTVCAVYLYRATGVVYGARGVSRIVKTALLTATVAVLVPGYRFAILLITLRLT